VLTLEVCKRQEVYPSVNNNLRKEQPLLIPLRYVRQRPILTLRSESRLARKANTLAREDIMKRAFVMSFTALLCGSVSAQQIDLTGVTGL
jgi:hypothetical protein